MADGKVQFGSVVSYDAGTEVLKFQILDGDLLDLTRDDLDERTIYHLSASHVPKDDSARQLKVANYARDIGLWKHSGRHYRMALKTATSEEEANAVYEQVEILTQKAASALLEEGKKAMKKKDTREAEETFELMLHHLPDQPQTIEAGQLYAQIQAERNEKKQARRAKRTEAKINKSLGEPEKNYDKMVEENREGLLSGSKRDTAERHFRSAVSHGEKAMKRLDKLVKDDDKALARASQDLHKDAKAALLDAQVNLGNHYYTYAKYKDAIEAASEALAIDPTYSEAKDLRKRAQNAERERREVGSEWLYWRAGTIRPGVQWR
jgi:tetratricopeptide (TPR) repeat protein